MEAQKTVMFKEIASLTLLIEMVVWPSDIEIEGKLYSLGNDRGQRK